MKTHLLILTFAVNLIAASTTGKIFGGGGLVDKSMNPALTANALLLESAGTALAPADKGLSLQAIEADLAASIDSYFYGSVVLATDHAGNVFPLEAYATTLSVPFVTFKAGKFLADFGKNNELHLHMQPLIDRPTVNQRILGNGMDSIGMEASVLVPVPWHFELIGGVLQAKPIFQVANLESLMGLARMEHRFDLTESTSLAFGGSFASGTNANARATSLEGVDVTIKYASGRGRGDFAVALINEFIRRAATAADGSTPTDYGLYDSLLIRLTQKFWVGGRFDYYKGIDLNTTTGENFLIAYVPSEFSTIRLQAGPIQNSVGGGGWVGYLQYNMTLGSHSAHAY